MAGKKGFVPIDRAWLESEEWTATPFDKVRAWIDLFSRASYTDTEEVQRGQLITSERELADRWQWPKTKVHRYLQELEDADRITRTAKWTANRTAKWTALTICNYSKYQDLRTAKRTAERTAKWTNTYIYNQDINQDINQLSFITDEERQALLQEFTPEAINELEPLIRAYYQEHQDKTFPGWIKAARTFSQNQKRWQKQRASREGQAITAFLAKGEAK